MEHNPKTKKPKATRYEDVKLVRRVIIDEVSVDPSRPGDAVRDIYGLAIDQMGRDGSSFDHYEFVIGELRYYIGVKHVADDND